MSVQSPEEAVKVVSSMSTIMLNTLHLRWLNTVCGQLCDTMCFKLDKETWRRKSNGAQNFYFYPILNNENFKMEVEKTNFVTHLRITVQYFIIIDYLKTHL